MDASRLRAAVRARLCAARPTRHLLIVTLLRLTIGGIALVLSPYFAFGYIDHLMKWGGTMFVFLAVYGLFGHLEGHVMNALVRVLDVVIAALRPRREPRYPVYSSGLNGWWDDDAPPPHLR